MHLVKKKTYLFNFYPRLRLQLLVYYTQKVPGGYVCAIHLCVSLHDSAFFCYFVYSEETFLLWICVL